MPSTRTPGESTPDPGRGSAPPPSAFVGRDRQIDTLLSAVDDAVAGRGRVILVGGEPGIGKTRLAEEFARHASKRGLRVLWGRSWEAGGAPAYWPWIQGLRSLLAYAPPAQLETIVGDGSRHLVQILPEIRDRLPDVPDALAASPEAARFELFVAINRLLESASREQPLVLILEDLHAADVPSLLLLRFVASTASEHRIVVVGTYRETELTKEHPLTAALPDLLRAPGATRLPLCGLTETDLVELIAAIAQVHASPDLVATLHRKTEGNPLFVEEFLRLLESENRLSGGTHDSRWRIPEGICEVIGRRLDRLSPACMETLTVASVVGRGFRTEILERASGRCEEELMAALQEAIGVRLVEEVHDDPGTMRFTHSLIRETVYQELMPAERHRLHAAVAEALEKTYFADREPYLAELAHHLFLAGPKGDREKTAEYATAAGKRAVLSLAYEEAIRLFRMALRPLQESPDERWRCEVLVLLGDTCARAGDQRLSKETFLAAAEIATRIADPDLLARTALGYAGRFPFARAGIDHYVIPLLRHALDALPATDDPLRARLLARLAGALRDQPSSEPRTSLAAEAVAVARRLGDPETLTYALLAWWGAALSGPDELDRQLSLAAELDDLAQTIGDRELRTNAVWVRYIASMTRGDDLEARRQHALLSDLAAELHQGPQLWNAGLLATVRALLDGRFNEAERLADETLALGQEAQAWDAAASRLFALFVLRREQGRLDELEDDLRHALVTHPGYRSIRCMLLALFVDVGRLDEARGLFEQLAAAGFAAFPRDNEWLFSMTLLSEAAAALRDEQRARVLYEQLLPYGDLVALAAWEVSAGPIARPLGSLAATLREYDEAARHFENAVEVCQRMATRPWLAHTRYAYAAMLLERGRSEDRTLARELAAPAREMCEEVGMTVLARRIEAVLAELTEQRVATPASKSPPGSTLTRRECEVARLLATGMSNRQIAEQLYVSERTAESHVQNILTKLGFGSRSQVALWAIREGLIEPSA